MERRPFTEAPKAQVVHYADASKRMAHRYDALDVFLRQADVVLEDRQPTSDVPETHVHYAPYELEHEMGKLMMAGEIDASEAYRRLEAACE